MIYSIFLLTYSWHTPSLEMRKVGWRRVSKRQYWSLLLSFCSDMFYILPLWNGRRDSYVTHRAYCVALAEETARLNAASSTNNNSTIAENNYHFLKPPHQIFSSSNIFRLNNSTDESRDHHMVFNNYNLTTPTIGLPFWMMAPAANNNNSHQINDLHDHHHPFSAASSVISAPSLYSNQDQQAHEAVLGNMSATVLLQKAAQIGVTSSTNDPSLMMGSSFGVKLGDGKGFFSGFYGTNYNSNSMPSCSSLENGGGEDSGGSNLVQMYPPAKRRHTVSEESVVSGGGEITRDFLGVGVHTICHPSAVNGWIWFDLICFDLSDH